MIKAIVYLTNTGGTARYARMAAKAAGLGAYPLKEAPERVEPGSEVFYMGWVMQGKIRGFARAGLRYAIPGLCGVGMTPMGEDTIRDMRARTGVTDPKVKVFYAQAGFDMKKLDGVHRLMMNAVRRSLAEQGGEEARAALALMDQGGDCVDFAKISPAVEWIKKYNRRFERP